MLEKVFTYTGARFYMDWLLPTNPKSYNPIICRWARGKHWTFRTLQSVHSGRDARKRLYMAYFWALLHLMLGIAMQLFVPHLWLLNLYANVYPIIVQLYIGYRCWVRIHKTNVIASEMK